LVEGGHAGKTYTLTGPEAWSLAEVATCLTRVLGRPIASAAPTPEEYRAVLLGEGAPVEIVSYLITVYGLVATGAVAAPTDDVLRLTGRAPRGTEEVLTELFGAGQPVAV
jgi:uncharacterized protein YbjT (DUF2867 family)